MMMMSHQTAFPIQRFCPSRSHPPGTLVAVVSSAAASLPLLGSVRAQAPTFYGGAQQRQFRITSAGSTVGKLTGCSRKESSCPVGSLSGFGNLVKKTIVVLRDLTSKIRAFVLCTSTLPSSLLWLYRHLLYRGLEGQSAGVEQSLLENQDID